ncbi:hypothetical protein CLU79DRAFT_735104 [Phycomyces nitens]|nr:hypothetical protein CLU79DRAFT_735104 [Phycomyces nitens]
MSLKVSVTDSELDQTALQRLWMFRIELKYGDIKWTIKRSIIEIYNLHLILTFKASVSSHLPNPPSFPLQLSRLLSTALIIRISQPDEEKAEVSHETLLKRRMGLEAYLEQVIQLSRFVINIDLCEFLELSGISIVKDMGWKGKEGYLETKVSPLPPSLIQSFRPTRGKEWVIIRDSYLAFAKSIDSSSPSDVFLFDNTFKVCRVTKKFAPYHQNKIRISNSSRSIELKCPTTRICDEWMDNLLKVQKESTWVTNHRFKSFAPSRQLAKAKWFIDGKDYFEAVAEAILSAKSEIYIEDWWLSPELYLQRPPKENDEYRIDRLLKRKASQGVMVYIVVYKDRSPLTLDSQHTVDWLGNIHPNIIVQRHASTTLWLWAHHEKIVVIDYRLAFIGGLDLCFGRYDTPEHTLSDYYGHHSSHKQVFPGQDYSNPRIKDFKNVSQYDISLIDKSITPRMPWHDVHVAMVGPPARDIARHFVQRWNFVKSTRAKDKSDLPFLLPKGEYVSSRDEMKFRGTCRIQVVRSSAGWSQGVPREHSIYTAYMECISKAKHFIYIENQFFIAATHPEDKIIKNKIGEALVERIKRAHWEGQKFRIIVVIPCAPGFEGDFNNPDLRSMSLRSVAHYQYMSISRGGSSILERLRAENIPAEEYIGFYSLRNWGKITPTPQAELHSKRRTSEPLSYPPPFLSSLTETTTSSSSLSRGFESKTEKSDGEDHLNSARHHKGKKKIHVRSVSEGKTPNLMSGSIRGNMSDGRLDYVTEQVYIHSKLMIIDDKIVLCGSANINDRSQLGHRDSEIAVVIEDTDLVPSRMNGEPYMAGRYALTLRMELFKEHLGLLQGSRDKHFPVQDTFSQQPNEIDSDNLVLDPLATSFNANWKKIAKRNTMIYRHLFRCVPDDTVHTFERHRKFVPDTNVHAGHIANPHFTNDEILNKLNEIQGHLVEFPTQYLCDANMTASIMQEATPPALFT